MSMDSAYRHDGFMGSSMKAVMRYRDVALIALEARAERRRASAAFFGAPRLVIAASAPRSARNHAPLADMGGFRSCAIPSRSRSGLTERMARISSVLACSDDRDRPALAMA
jgi:hypothetical protein